MPQASDQVVIVVAGLAGLVTASELAGQGIQTLVLEAQARIGGRIRTIAVPDGARAEAAARAGQRMAALLGDRLGAAKVLVP